MEENKMGKGNRNKLDRSQGRIETPEEYLANRRKLNKKQKNKSGLGITITCIVLVAVIVLTLVGSALASSGIIARMTNSLTTENFTVTEAMLTFFYNEYLMNWYSQNQMYVLYKMYNVDFTRDLSAQPCSLLNNEGSWQDYFMSTVIDNVKMYLAYAEGALALGMELDDEDKADIDAAVDNIKATVKSAGEKISTRYGKSVSARDIRKCYEIIQLASKFNDHKLEELEAIIREDGEAIEKYPEDHKEDFYTADYMSYTITVKSNDTKIGGDKTKFEDAKKAAKENADVIASAKDTDKFFEEIQAYIEATKKAEEESKDTSSSETPTLKPTEGTTTTTKEPTAEDYEKTISYGTSSDLEKWIFVENAKENACTVIVEESSEEVTKKGSTTKEIVYTYKVTAYMLKKAPHLDDALTFNIGYVIATDKALIEELRASFMTGEMSAKALEELGLNKQESLPSDTTIQMGAASGKNVEPNAFKGSYQALHDWLNAEGRKAGDLSEVIEIKPQKDGDKTYYVLCYFEDLSDPVYKAQAIGSMVGEAMDEWYMGEDGIADNNGGQLGVTPVTVKDKSKKRVKVCDYLKQLYALYGSYYG